MKEKKSIEFNFATFIVIFAVIIVIVFVIARHTGMDKKINIGINENDNKEVTQKEEKLYTNDVITIDEGKFTDNWQIVEDSYGSIVFYIQGPKKESEDGSYYDIRINMYISKSELSNQDLKKQMLEDSIYSKIEYNREKEINGIKWMEFSAQKENAKAKILAVMKDGYMYAIEINGEEELYKEYYKEAETIIETTQISNRITKEDASKLIYKYDNIANIKEGGSEYLLKSLNLPENAEKTEENSNLPEEYKDYVWTGIVYDDFANEMKKYMTTEVLEKHFSEFINYKNCLYRKDYKNEQRDYVIEEINPKSVRGNETTYEVIKTDMNIFQTIKQNITVKSEDGKLVISNIE
jgi:hypothetical protein